MPAPPTFLPPRKTAKEISPPAPIGEMEHWGKNHENMDVRHRGLLDVLQPVRLPVLRGTDDPVQKAQRSNDHDGFVATTMVRSGSHPTAASVVPPIRSDITRYNGYLGYKQTGHKLPSYGLLYCAARTEDNRADKRDICRLRGPIEDLLFTICRQAKSDRESWIINRRRLSQNGKCHCESLRRCAADVRKKMAFVNDFAVTRGGSSTWSHFPRSRQNLFS